MKILIWRHLVAKNIFGRNQFIGLFVSFLSSEWHKIMTSPVIVAIETISNGFEKNWRKKFWIEKIFTFTTESPLLKVLKLWSITNGVITFYSFPSLTFPDWKWMLFTGWRSAQKLQFKQFWGRLRLKTGAKLRKIWEKIEFYQQKHNFF